MELPSFANENTGHPGESEFRMNNEWPFKIEVCLKFKLSCVLYFLSAFTPHPSEASEILLSAKTLTDGWSPRTCRAFTSGLGLCGLF